MSSDEALEFENPEDEVSRWPSTQLEPPMRFISGNTDGPVDYLKLTPVSISFHSGLQHILAVSKFQELEKHTSLPLPCVLFLFFL